MINGEIMGTVAIVLIVIGIICVIISIILGITDNKEPPHYFLGPAVSGGL